MSVKKFVVYTVLALGAVVFWCHTHSDRAKIARLFAVTLIKYSNT